MAEAMDETLARYEMERKEGWTDLIQQILPLEFPAEWRIRILPPFGGAAVRFWAEKDCGTVSVYLDSRDRLGYMGRPYWEIYPAEDGDTARFYLGEDEAEMIEEIRKSLAVQNRKKSG